MSWQPEAPVIFVGKQIVLDESVFSVSPFLLWFISVSYSCCILLLLTSQKPKSWVFLGTFGERKPISTKSRVSCKSSPAELLEDPT